jgi:hypothetical protein
VRLHLRARQVRAVQGGPPDRAVFFPGRPGIGGRRYSHDHQTADNPEGVWTLIRIPGRDQAIFLRVAADCGGVSRTIRRQPDSTAAKS